MNETEKKLSDSEANARRMLALEYHNVLTNFANRLPAEVDPLGWPWALTSKQVNASSSSADKAYVKKIDQILSDLIDDQETQKPISDGLVRRLIEEEIVRLLSTVWDIESGASVDWMSVQSAINEIQRMKDLQDATAQALEAQAESYRELARLQKIQAEQVTAIAGHLKTITTQQKAQWSEIVKLLGSIKDSLNVEEEANAWTEEKLIAHIALRKSIEHTVSSSSNAFTESSRASDINDQLSLYWWDSCSIGVLREKIWFDVNSYKHATISEFIGTIDDRMKWLLE